MQKPAAPKRGKRLSAGYLDEVRRGGVYRATAVGGQVRHTSAGLSIAAPRQAAAIVMHFKIVSISDNYLTCNPVTPPTTADTSQTVYVAKPWQFRRIVLDGASVTYQNGQAISYIYASGREREADDGTDTETQVMTPDYFVGEILLAVSGYTGVAAGSDYCQW